MSFRCTSYDVFPSLIKGEKATSRILDKLLIIQLFEETGLAGGNLVPFVLRSGESRPRLF